MNNWILPDKSTDKAKELFQKAEERNALLEKSRSPNYVLLDAALWGTAINDLFKDENTSFRSLFKGSAGDELWNAAPYLVETSPNGTFLEKINEIIRTGNPNRRATWLSSSLGIDGLCKHLRRFLRLRKEDGGHLYFRFYDPYVANVVFPNLTKGQASNFFEKIEFLVTEDARIEEKRVFYLSPEKELQIIPQKTDNHVDNK